MYKSGLALAMAKSNISLDQLASLSSCRVDDLHVWADGAAIPAEHLSNLAMHLGVAPTVLEGTCLGAEGDATGKVGLDGDRSDDREMESCWGRVGFLIPGISDDIWSSISDRSINKFEEDFKQEPDYIVLRGMGLNGYIAFPDHLDALHFFSKPAVGFPGNWKMPIGDVAGGLPPAYVTSISERHFDLLRLDCSDEYQKFMFDLTIASGGLDEIKAHGCTMDIFLTSGRKITTYIEIREKWIAKFVLGSGFYDCKYFEIEPGGTGLKIPMSKIALIRLPVWYLDPERYTGMGKR